MSQPKIRSALRPISRARRQRDVGDMRRALTRTPALTFCPVCGMDGEFESHAIIGFWLSRQWKLTREQRSVINVQQGHACTGCGQNLRSRALARGVLRALGQSAPLSQALASAGELRVLEVNPAGGLTTHLAAAAHHTVTSFPDVDMQHLPFDDGSFDLVVHSDTLEHVPDPAAGLRECLRVVGSGWVVFTTPILPNRLSRKRPTRWPRASYHGGDTGRSLVHYEFGADFWCTALLAGAWSVEIDGLDFPYAIVVTCRASSGVSD